MQQGVIQTPTPEAEAQTRTIDELGEALLIETMRGYAVVEDGILSRAHSDTTAAGLDHVQDALDTLYKPWLVADVRLQSLSQEGVVIENPPAPDLTRVERVFAANWAYYTMGDFGPRKMFASEFDHWGQP